MAFAVRRGTNISHWLSQSKDRGEKRRAWFTRQDARWLADQGFDHLRLPVDEEQMWDADGKREAEAFDLLQAALEWCKEDRLRAIVDLHILRSHYFLDKEPALFREPAAAQRFADLWRDMSQALRGRRTDDVAFELMNEPVAAEPGEWNRVAKMAYDALRAQEPEATGRVIVLGSNRWNSVDTFDALAVPADRNLLLTFHYYHPMLVTHHRAPWCKSICDYAGPIRYPGQPVADEELVRLPEPLQTEVQKENRHFDAAVMEQDLAKPLAVNQRTGNPLYCGEFGVLNTVADDMRGRWYRDFIGVLDRHAIGWANWDYRGGFGVVGKEGRKPTAVLKGLMG